MKKLRWRRRPARAGAWVKTAMARRCSAGVLTGARGWGHPRYRPTRGRRGKSFPLIWTALSAARPYPQVKTCGYPRLAPSGPNLSPQGMH